MCTLMKTSDMPEMKNGNIVRTGQKKFISLFLKPNEEGENYRFRLLWYKQSSKNDRKTPYFTQSIHDHWGENAKGVQIVDDTVICPGTKYVHYDEEKFLTNEKTGKKYLNCPICQKAEEYRKIANASGWRDKVATKKFFALKSKFRAIVPVYVVHDPNTKKVDESTGEVKYINDKQLRVLIFTNKDEFEMFDNLVNEEKSKAYLSSKEGHGYEIFNGENAVDLFIHVENKEEIRNEGKSNEYTAHVRKITGIKFGTKIYDIPDITADAVNSFEMDDQFYVSNTKAELQEFCDKYYGHKDVKVPDEDISFDTTPVKTQTVISQENKVKPNPVTISESEIDELTTDPDDIPFETTKESAPMDDTSANSPMSDSEIDNILDGM